MYEDLTDVWDAFQGLSACRTCGLGPNPIGWDQMLAWFEIHGIEDADVRDTYCRLIMVMDRVFLDHAAEAVKNGG